MPRPVRFSLLVGVLAVGCGGGSGGYAGATSYAGVSGGAGTTGRGGGGGQAGGGSGLGVVTGSRVFAGVASMLFDGPSCTAEAGATGDCWCAFVALSSTGTRNLFVVDVSQVAAGVAVTCGAPDPSCLLLTPSLGGDSSDPTLHGTFFQGDTLVYYDDALAPYVWRPGMTEGRLLAAVSATLDAVFCTPAPKGTAVACLGLPSTQPDASLVVADLLAGKADGGGEPLLTVVDTVIAANAADRGGTPRFGYGFPAVAGDYVAWTSRATASGPEILKLQKAGDPASQSTVASDVHGWHVSPDGTRWFWLSAIDRTGVGTLQTAPFPGGASPTDVQASVLQFGLPPTGGETVVTLAISGAMAAIADPVAAPTARIALDTQVQELLSFNAEGHVAYVKHFGVGTLVDLFVKKVDGTGACTIDATVEVPFASVQFSPNAGAALWARAKTDGFDGLYTRLSDCSTMSLASNVVAHGSIGHETIVFMDQFDEATRTGSIRFRTVAAGNMLETGTPTLVADQVDTYAISGPAPGALLYTVNGGGSADGVYIRWFGP